MEIFFNLTLLFYNQYTNSKFEEELKIMKRTLLLVVISALIFSAIGFAASTGTINIVGSTSVQPLAEELAQAYMAKNPGVKIFVQGGGSGAGIKAAMTNTKSAPVRGT
jgi:ABC-type phosphate transport system substrate-binding protein